MKHEPLCYKLWAKVAAYFLLTLIVIPLVGSVAGIVFDVTTEAYQKDVHDVRIDQFSRSVSSLGFTVLNSVLNERASRAQDFADMSNATFRVVAAKTALQRVQWTAEDFGDVPETYAFVLYYTVYEAESTGYYYNYDGFSEKDDAAPLQKGHARVYVRIDPSFPIRDELYALDKIIGFAYSQRYAFWGIAAVCLLILVLCFLFILSGAGHKPGAEEPVAGYFFRVPYDVITAALVFAFSFALEWIFERPNDIMEGILLSVLALAALPVFTGWCAALAARIKCGGWLKYTLTGRILGALAWLLRAL